MREVLKWFCCAIYLATILSLGTGCNGGDVSVQVVVCGNGKKMSTEIFVSYDTAPAPVDGIAALVARIQYPEEARRNGIEGDVAIQVLVCRDGAVVDTRILQSPGHGLDEEAERVVRSVQWQPAQLRQEPVTAWATLNVPFRLQRK